MVAEVTRPLGLGIAAAPATRANAQPRACSSGAFDAAFQALLARQRGDLVRFASWLTGDRFTAEEIVQESMLRAWRARDSLRNEGALRSWLLTIVRREHARLHERKHVPTLPLDEVPEEQQSDLSVPDEQDLAELRATVAALPRRYREPLLMQVIGGYSTSQIARELGLTQAAVLTRLFRARNALRERYAVPGRKGDT